MAKEIKNKKQIINLINKRQNEVEKELLSNPLIKKVVKELAKT